MSTTSTPHAGDFPGKEELVAEIEAAMSQLKTASDLVGFAICAVMDVVLAKARAKGVTNPDRDAVRDAAITYTINTFREDLPKVWADYCRETGLIDEPEGEES